MLGITVVPTDIDTTSVWGMFYTGSTTPVDPPVAGLGALLYEDGTFLLLEDGGAETYLLLESA